MKDEIKEKMTIGKAKKILRGFLEKDCYYDTPLYYAIPYLLDYITNLQDRIRELEQINEEHRKLNGELREENKELKMTNLALADDITKNKIIKQEVLTECCGIPIGEIPMLKIQNDDYKTRNEKAINCINHYATENDDYSKLYSTEEEELLEILQGSDE